MSIAEVAKQKPSQVETQVARLEAVAANILVSVDRMESKVQSVIGPPSEDPKEDSPSGENVVPLAARLRHIAGQLATARGKLDSVCAGIEL